MGVVGLAENKATQPSLAGAWAELGNIPEICLRYAQDKFVMLNLKNKP